MSGKDGTPGNDKSYSQRSVLGMNVQKLPTCVLWVIGGELPVGHKNYGWISYIQPSLNGLYNAIANCIKPDGICVRKAMRPPYGGTCGVSCSIGQVWLRQNSIESLHRSQVVNSIRKPQNRVLLFGGHANETGLYLNGGCRLLYTSTLAGGKGRIAILLGCYIADNTYGEPFGAKLSKIGWRVITTDKMVLAYYLCVFADGLRSTISEVPSTTILDILPVSELQIGEWVIRANHYACNVLLYAPPIQDPSSFIWDVEWASKYMIYLPAK